MTAVDFKAGWVDDWAFACETCLNDPDHPSEDGCASMWCPCPCNNDVTVLAPQVTGEARFGPGRCYFCGGLLDDPANDVGVDEEHPDGAVVDDRTCLDCLREQRRVPARYRRSINVKGILA